MRIVGLLGKQVARVPLAAVLCCMRARPPEQLLGQQAYRLGPCSGEPRAWLVATAAGLQAAAWLTAANCRVAELQLGASVW